MNKKDNDDHIILFRGLKMTRRRGKQLGYGLVFGFVGVLISIGIFGPGNKFAALVVILVFAFIGFFGLTKKLSGK